MNSPDFCYLPSRASRCGNEGQGGALQPRLLLRDIWSGSEPSRGCPELAAASRSLHGTCLSMAIASFCTPSPSLSNIQPSGGHGNFPPLCFLEGSAAPLQAREPLASLTSAPRPHPSFHQWIPVRTSGARGCSPANLSLEQCAV